MRAALIAFALSSTSCVTSVYHCEYYRPQAARTSIELAQPGVARIGHGFELFATTPSVSVRRPLAPPKIHWNVLSTADLMEGILFPVFPLLKLYVESTNASSRYLATVRCQHRMRRFYAGGIILPVVPLFGLFGDPNDRSIILAVKHPLSVTVDAARVRGRFDQSQREIRVTAVGTSEHLIRVNDETTGDEFVPTVSSVTDYLALDAPYGVDDSFTLILVLCESGGETTLAPVHFTLEGELIWDKFGGTGPQRFPMSGLVPLE